MTTPATWIELSITRVGNEILLGVRGSRDESLPPRSLGIDEATLQRFTASAQKAAEYRKPLPPKALADAYAIQRAVLDGDVATLFAQLREFARKPLLVRFSVHDPDLQAVPWEALTNSAESIGFWGTSENFQPVRTVASIEPWEPREVDGAVRVLAIAPTDTGELANLRQALDRRITTGEVEWLDPVQGAGAKVPAILDRLRREPTAHIIHFLGHGGFDAQGRPALRMADDDDEPQWLATEVLAQQLKANFRGTLRVMVLEACETAAPTAFLSSAEILGKAGADAVVAYLWPVRGDIARMCSTQLYRALSSAQNDSVDMAFALNEARRAILAAHEASAEAMSPVLYLRGPTGKIFDFNQRKVTAPRALVTSTVNGPPVPPPLARVFQAPYSLVLGDRWKDQNKELETFRAKLRGELTNEGHAVPQSGLPTSTLLQWFVLHRGAETLEEKFQEAFDVDMAAPPIITKVAQGLCPGVHTTLLRNPWLENTVAEQQPRRTIYVIQPYDTGAFVAKREAGAGNKWERLRDAPERFDDTQDILVLRPYRGYTSNKKFARPLLTEDDYFLRLRDLWSGQAMPSHLAELLGGTLSRRPALLVGLSMLTANHRMLLHALYARGIPHRSLAVVDEADHERRMWERGSGLPGRDEGVEVLETSSALLCEMLDAAYMRGYR